MTRTWRVLTLFCLLLAGGIGVGCGSGSDRTGAFRDANGFLIGTPPSPSPSGTGSSNHLIPSR
jgi:hypothetical protein